MMPENWGEYLKNEKFKYKRLGCVECPVFGGEKVYFNGYGLNHLMYKGRVSRPREEVFKRFSLLLYVTIILRNLKNVDGEERSIKDKSTAYFWVINHKVSKGLYLRIILRRLNNGRLHFFSVMKE